MVLEKSIKTSFSNGLERIYIYKITEQLEKSSCEYGIEVELKYIMKGENVKNIKEEVKNISSKKEEVIDILQLLCRNEASPLHLLDILQDYIDRDVIQYNC